MYNNTMLDKQTYKLLGVLSNICTDDSYKIIETSDLLNQVSPTFNGDVQFLAQVLKYLSNNEMIDIKYNDDKVYCIAVLPKGRAYSEPLPGKQKSKIINHARRGWFIMIGSFTSAFLGALLAGLIVGLM